MPTAIQNRINRAAGVSTGGTRVSARGTRRNAGSGTTTRTRAANGTYARTYNATATRQEARNAGQRYGTRNQKYRDIRSAFGLTTG